MARVAPLRLRDRSRGPRRRRRRFHRRRRGSSWPSATSRKGRASSTWPRELLRQRGAPARALQPWPRVHPLAAMLGELTPRTNSWWRAPCALDSSPSPGVSSAVRDARHCARRCNWTYAVFIDPGSPWQALPPVPLERQPRRPAYRDEILNRQQFEPLIEAKVLLEDWRIDYNMHRPHSAHGWLTPDRVRRGLATPTAAHTRIGSGSTIGIRSGPALEPSERALIPAVRRRPPSRGRPSVAIPSVPRLERIQ